MQSYKADQYEIDSDSDEDKFWDAQNEFGEYDEGTLDPGVDKEYSIDVPSDNSVEAEVDRNLQQTKYNGTRHQRKGKLGHNMMIYISCFLILFGKMTQCAENKT